MGGVDKVDEATEARKANDSKRADDNRGIVETDEAVAKLMQRRLDGRSSLMAGVSVSGLDN